MSGARRPGSEADLLRSAPILVATPAEVESERERLVPWLEQQILELPTRRTAQRQAARRTWLVAGSALAAAAAALAVVALEPWAERADAERADAEGAGEVAAAKPVDEPAATLLEGRLESGALQVLPGSRLGDASRFRTPADAGARLRTAVGATLAAAPGTEFVLAHAAAGHADSPAKASAGEGAMIQLARGAIDVAVPKLGRGRSFQVKTDDALVTVVGTRFFVGAGSTTCVRVEEGSVRVERAGETRLLAPGDSWGCALPALGSAEEPRVVAPTRRAEKPSARESQLDQQNRLLAMALAAERRGDVARARAAFGELLQRHPDSPFGPEARAGLARLQGR